jgi:hypothetical protein
MIDEQRGGAQMPPPDTTAATENAEFHGYLVLKVVTPSQSAGGGSLRNSAIRSV